MAFEQFLNRSSFEPNSAPHNESDLAKAFTHSDKYMVMKWEHYLGIYERLLAPFVRENRPVRLLEIGVQNGGSLELFKRYLPAGSFIVGVDINPNCNKLEFSDGIKFIHGDATDYDFLQKHFSKISFDIIIDDGSHFPKDVIKSFNFLFSRLNFGGYYIVEDSHSSYFNPYNSRLKDPNSHIEFFKDFVDFIHYKYFMKYENLTDEQHEIMKKYNEQVAAISFYDSVIIIEKYLKKRVEPFRNYLTEGQSLVVPKQNNLGMGLACDKDTVLEKIYRN